MKLIAVAVLILAGMLGALQHSGHVTLEWSNVQKTFSS